MADLVSWVSGPSHLEIDSNLRQRSRKGTVLAGLEEEEPLSERPTEESTE